jgi:hypothetical protein
MSLKFLKEQVLPTGAENTYVRLLLNGEVAGNAFGTRWMYQDRPILWITQLCVSREYRNQGIAKKLLQSLHQDEHCVGILSSHPFAILAVLRVFGRGLEDVGLKMTRDQARGVMDSCPVRYVKTAKLNGSLFDADITGPVSCADTGFWVDHQEPMDALKIIEGKGRVWPLGHLPEGHEFLILVEGETSG